MIEGGSSRRLKKVYDPEGGFTRRGQTGLLGELNNGAQ